MPRYSKDLLFAVETFFESLDPSTARSYRQKLNDFRRFVKRCSLNSLASWFKTVGPARTAIKVDAYLNKLKKRSLAPGTINTYMSAIRSILKALHHYHLITWQINVKGVRSQKYRNTAGPGFDGIRRLVDFARERGDKKGMRDYAMLRIIYESNLRRQEIVNLTWSEVDWDAGELSVIRKKRREPIKKTLSPQALEALLQWKNSSQCRELGPVFYSLRRHHPRLSGSGVYFIISKLGTDAGVTRVTPTGIRHAATTRALELTNNTHAVKDWADHVSFDTTNVYNDNRLRAKAEITNLLASEI